MQGIRLSRIAGAMALIGAIGVAALAFADGADVIKARRALMKANGDGAKVMGAMLEGKSPFDAKAAAAAATATAAAAHGFGVDFDKNFAAGSETGDTKASPDIWKNKDDFVKRAMALETDANAVVAAAATGEDAFKAAAGKMFGNCKGCHEKYKLQ